MSRRGEYFDAMVRHLGAVYYQTLQGQASADDVAKAVEAVRARQAAADRSGRAEVLATKAATTASATGAPVSGQAAGGHVASGQAPGGQRTNRWRIADVMSSDWRTVSKNMPYKQVAQLMADHHLTAVPVVSDSGRVLGMVSEADLLRKEERSFGRLSAGLPKRSHHERVQADALTAAELMTSPAITIHPDAPLGAAARLMNARHVRRLPVVDPAGHLVGMVSRRDLLSVFLQPDDEIGAQVAAMLEGAALAGSDQITVAVVDGIVTLGGVVPDAGIVERAIRLASEVDGVVAVRRQVPVAVVPGG
jgi:CBS domain-containing protein